MSFATIAVAVLSGCGGSDAGTTAPRSSQNQSITVVSGGGLTDTIFARPTSPLVVQVRDSTGKPRAGLTIRFEALSSQSRPSETTLLVGPAQNGTYSAQGQAQTDSLGIARTFIAFGSVAGSVQLVVRAVDLGLVDTVSYAVNPGVAVQSVIGILSDTTIRPGTSFSLGVRAFDRYRNPALAQTTYTSSDGITVVSPAGVVTAPSQTTSSTITSVVTAAGRRIGQFTTYVYVVPVLPIVGVATGNFESGIAGIWVGDTYTNSSTGVLASSFSVSMAPSRVARTDLVAYYEGDVTKDGTISVVDSKKSKRVLVSAANGFRSAGWPRVSPDGDWVYFIGMRSSASSLTLWRIRVDGTQLDSLMAYGGGSRARPAVSPDGKYVVLADGTGLRVFDTSARSAQQIAQPCIFPDFSPDGTKISCVATNAVIVLNRDGSVFKKFTPIINPFEGGADWTPDGSALFVQDEGESWRLYNLTTGAVVQVLNLTGLYQATIIR